MNYLGHAFLSFGDAEILTGNLLGDHVKGSRILDSFPAKIRKGIELHRKIDTFSDQHAAINRAKILFRKDYGLYAGAILDTLMDHFLANDPKIFPDEPSLMQFSQTVYVQLSANDVHIPEQSKLYFKYMKEQNWLYGYRFVKGMEKALNGLHRRAKHMPAPETAYQIFIANYYHLNQCYFELIDDLVPFVKNELEV